MEFPFYLSGGQNVSLSNVLVCFSLGECHFVWFDWHGLSGCGTVALVNVQ